MDEKDESPQTPSTPSTSRFSDQTYGSTLVPSESNAGSFETITTESELSEVKVRRRAPHSGYDEQEVCSRVNAHRDERALSCQITHADNQTQSIKKKWGILPKTPSRSSSSRAKPASSNKPSPTLPLFSIVRNGLRSPSSPLWKLPEAFASSPLASPSASTFASGNSAYSAYSPRTPSSLRAVTSPAAVNSAGGKYEGTFEEFLRQESTEPTSPQDSEEVSQQGCDEPSELPKLSPCPGSPRNTDKGKRGREAGPVDVTVMRRRPKHTKLKRESVHGWTHFQSGWDGDAPGLPSSDLADNDPEEWARLVEQVKARVWLEGEIETLKAEGVAEEDLPSLSATNEEIAELYSKRDGADQIPSEIACDRPQHADVDRQAIDTTPKRGIIRTITRKISSHFSPKTSPMVEFNSPVHRVSVLRDEDVEERYIPEPRVHSPMDMDDDSLWAPSSLQEDDSAGLGIEIDASNYELERERELQIATLDTVPEREAEDQEMNDQDSNNVHLNDENSIIDQESDWEDIMDIDTLPARRDKGHARFVVSKGTENHKALLRKIKEVAARRKLMDTHPAFRRATQSRLEDEIDSTLNVWIGATRASGGEKGLGHCREEEMF